MLVILQNNGTQMLVRKPIKARDQAQDNFIHHADLPNQCSRITTVGERDSINTISMASINLYLLSCNPKFPMSLELFYLYFSIRLEELIFLQWLIPQNEIKMDHVKPYIYFYHAIMQLAHLGISMQLQHHQIHIKINEDPIRKNKRKLQTSTTGACDMLAQ